MFSNYKSPIFRKYKSFKFYSEVQYRRYLTYFQLRKNKFPDTKNAFGVYVAPLFNYEYGEQHYNTPEELNDNTVIDYSEDKFYNAIQGGILAGVNFDILYGKISLQLNVGAAYKHSWLIHNKSHENVFDYRKMNGGIMAYGTTGFIPKVNFQIGYNF